ncbi:MAG TPA: redoxin domain-containing protein, partial [Candidatus Eisenbacteria bacterium]|nr:redoxin domain-containing protein [Candidatus Eisenbacteria bacterium]
VLSGRRIAAWRAERAHEAEVGRLHRGEASKLRTGDVFPHVDLVDPGGRETTTTALLLGQDALVLFVARDCDPCTQVVLNWSPYLGKEGAELPAIIAIAAGSIDDVAAYANETGLPFPVFADTQDVFRDQFELHNVPTVIGVRANGTMAFIRHGISEDFTPETARGLMVGPG